MPEAREAARKYFPKALEVLARLMVEGESDMVKLRAAEAICDRAHGRPPQAVDLSGEAQDAPVVFTLKIDRPSDRPELDESSPANR